MEREELFSSYFLPKTSIHAVLMSTHSLCFRAKIRKTYTPVHTSFTILNDTSNVTDKVFAIFSKVCKIFKRKFQGSAKNIWDDS